MKAKKANEHNLRKTRFMNLDKTQNIVYLKSIRPGTYAEILFDCGNKIVVGYSLNYLYSLVGYDSFIKVNRGVIVNKLKIFSQNKQIVLSTGHVFSFSRRELKKSINNNQI